MKKKFLCITLGLVMALSGQSYAESLDTTYLDYLWQKLDEKSVSEKQSYGSQLKNFMTDSEGLDAVKKIYERMLSESQVKELTAMGLTQAEVSANLDKLKTWSVSERYQLIDLAIAGDKSGLLALNASKAAVTPSTPSTPGTGGSTNGSSSSGSNTGAAPGGVNTPAVPLATLPEQPKPSEIPASAAKPSSTWAPKDLAKLAITEVPKFTDLETHWSKPYINYFAERGIIAGKADQKMAPDSVISQAEMMTILAKVFYNQPSALGSEKEALVTKAWYEPYYKTVSEAQWFKSTLVGFKPNAQMTRQEVAKTLNALGNELGIVNLEAYLVQGDQNGNKNLTKKVTRAEFLTMLYKLVEQYNH